MKEEWIIEKLGKFCSISTGSSNTNEAVLDGKYAFFDRSKVVKRSNRFLFDCEAIIIPGEGQEFFPKYFSGKFDLHQRAYALYNFSEKVDIQYIYKYLIYFHDYFGRVAVGATAKSLRLRHFEDLPFPLPPISEQKRIVAVLDAAFTAIAKAKENTEKNLANARELFDSYLQNIFARPGEDWEERKLGDIGKVSMCKRVFKDQTTNTGDIPFYKIGTFGKRPDAYISKEIYDEFRKKFSFPKKGEILISASGTIGRRVKYDGEPAYFQDSNIVWIENDEKQVLNDYLFSFYGACNWGSTVGATIARLYNGNLRQIKISFPKSLDEQRVIVGTLVALSAENKKLESIYQRKIADLEELKKSILQKAFSGELVGAQS